MQTYIEIYDVRKHLQANVDGGQCCLCIAAESFRVKCSSSRAGTVSDLLRSLIIYLFQQE